MYSFSHITYACLYEGDRQHHVTEYGNEAHTKIVNSQGDG